jgi:DNA/RNA-binding domain of Phe-tRNA-synthetase-like protein
MSLEGRTIFTESEDCVGLGLRAGAMVFRSVRVSPASAKLRTEIADEVGRIRTRLSSASEIRSIPEIVKAQDILRTVGVKSRRRISSTESLLRFALKHGALPSINNLVDAYNLVSLRTSSSLGAHDLDRIATPVELRLLCGGERFVPLGSAEEEAVTAGEFGYVDALDRVICRLDIQQADFCKVTAATTNVLLIIEATTVHDSARLRRVFEETEEIIKHHCGGEAEVVAFPY